MIIIWRHSTFTLSSICLIDGFVSFFIISGERMISVSSMYTYSS